MELTRTEILPGVWLSHLRAEESKTACLSLSLLTQLKRETAAMNALIPFVLRRGTTRYPDLDALSARLESLGGMTVEPSVRRVGEIQCVGFSAVIPEGTGGRLRDASELLGQLLLAPATRGGLLLPRYVDEEREQLLETIRSRRGDRRDYARQRCVEEMCCCENFAVSPLGGEDECEAINYKKLTRQYHDLLRQSPVEIFSCGRAGAREVSAALREALVTLPREEMDEELGTDVRMNALEAEPRFVEEEAEEGPGELAIGWRLGECMEDPDQAAILVFSAVFGGEASQADTHKGLLLVSAEGEPEELDAARDAIFRRLEAIRQGELSEEELAAARASVAAALRAGCENLAALEDFWLSQTLDGLDYGPLELAALAEDVTREDVLRVAESLDCDLIYTLKRGAGEED